MVNSVEESRSGWASDGCEEGKARNRRPHRVELASGPVDVLSVADLIDMKRESGRPQDIEDIRALEQLR